MPSVFTVGVSTNPEIMGNAAERLFGQTPEAISELAKDIIFGQLRLVIASMMIEEINAFVRYNFQDNSVYADKVIDGGVYGTACSDTLGIREKLTVGGSGDVLTVTDNRGNNIAVNANSGKVVNQMARDYVFSLKADAVNSKSGKPEEKSITTSSFAVVHQISSPLNYHRDTDRYDGLWSGTQAKKKLSAFRRLYDSRLYQKY